MSSSPTDRPQARHSPVVALVGLVAIGALACDASPSKALLIADLTADDPFVTSNVLVTVTLMPAGTPLHASYPAPGDGITVSAIPASLGILLPQTGTLILTVQATVKGTSDVRSGLVFTNAVVGQSRRVLVPLGVPAGGSPDGGAGGDGGDPDGGAADGDGAAEAPACPPLDPHCN
jgi:hypothetical protein